MEFEKALTESGIIAIIRGKEIHETLKIAEGLIEGGIEIIEITYDSPDALETVGHLREKYTNEVFVGVGTVLESRHVKDISNAGAQFILSPDVNESVIKETKKNNLISIPGALTPTEIRRGMKFGADYIKLFPCVNINKDYMNAISAPLSNVKLIPTGGITAENMKNYYTKSTIGFGIGNSLINHSNNPNELFGKAQLYINEFQTLRRG